MLKAVITANARTNVCFLRFIFFSLFELRRNRATYLQVFLFLTGTQTFQKIFLTRPIRGEARLGRRSWNSVAAASLRRRSALVTVPKACTASIFQANGAKCEE